MRQSACPTCNGEGKIPDEPCEVCDGLGRLRKERTYEVDIPAGIETGQRIRVSGKGHEGEAGAAAGDLYVEVQVIGDDRFERHGEHLVTPAQISVTRAMLGGTIEIPTLEGMHEVTVPKGAQPGPAGRALRKGPPDPQRQAAGRSDRRPGRRRARGSSTESSATRPRSWTPSSTIRIRADDPPGGALQARPGRAGPSRACAARARGSGGGDRGLTGSSTPSTAPRESSPISERSRRRPATSWSRSRRSESPTTGPTAGGTSTSRR